MVRANLLPRPKERIGIGGFDCDIEDVRHGFYGIFTIVAVVVMGVSIEVSRLHRLDDAASKQEARLTLDAPQRARVKSLALDLARYQRFAREAENYGRSGADVAIAIARIGNGVRARVWVDTLDHQNDTFAVSGVAKSVDSLGLTIVSLGRALPRTHAMLVNIDNRASEGVHFSARIAEAKDPNVATSPIDRRPPHAALPPTDAIVAPAGATP